MQNFTTEFLKYTQKKILNRKLCQMKNSLSYCHVEKKTYLFIYVESNIDNVFVCNEQIHGWIATKR